MEPSSRTHDALRSYLDATVALERARLELHQAIVADLDAGVRQADLVRLTGYTRERIRQLARAAGRIDAMGQDAS